MSIQTLIGLGFVLASIQFILIEIALYRHRKRLKYLEVVCAHWWEEEKKAKEEKIWNASTTKRT